MVIGHRPHSEVIWASAPLIINVNHLDHIVLSSWWTPALFIISICKFRLHYMPKLIKVLVYLEVTTITNIYINNVILIYNLPDKNCISLCTSVWPVYCQTDEHMSIVEYIKSRDITRFSWNISLMFIK